MFPLEAQILQTFRLIAQISQELLHRLGQDGARALLLDIRDVDAERFGGGEVARGVRGAGEAEDGRGGDGDGDAVRDDGRGYLVAGVFVAGVLA